MNPTERILSLLDRYGITATQLIRETNLNNSSITEWKKGRAKPSAEAIVRIANYFGVSTDYLLTGKEFEESESSETTSLTIPQELQSLCMAIKSGDINYTQNELDEIGDFLEFLKLKRDSRNKKDMNNKKSASKQDAPSN